MDGMRQTTGDYHENHQAECSTSERTDLPSEDTRCENREGKMSNVENLNAIQEQRPKPQEQNDEPISPWDEKQAKKFKLALYILNGLVVFMSLAVIACAFHDLSILKTFQEVSRGRNKVSDIVLIIGVIAGGSLAVFGCISASKKKRQGLHVEAGGLLVLMIVLVSLAAVLMFQRPTEDLILKDRLAESFAKAPGSSADRDGWDYVEKTYKCCGNLGPRDYSLPMTPPHIPPEVSLSCCTNARVNASYVDNHRLRRTCIQQKLYYQNGCQPLVAELFATSSVAVVVSMLVLAILQILVIIIIGLTLLNMTMTKNKDYYTKGTLLDVLVLSGILIGTIFTVTSSIILSQRPRIMAEVGALTILVTSALSLSALIIIFVVGPHRKKRLRA